MPEPVHSNPCFAEWVYAQTLDNSLYLVIAWAKAGLKDWQHAVYVAEHLAKRYDLK